MVDGVNNRVSFVNNTLTTLAAPVRHRGVPSEEIVTNEFLKFNASVSKISIGRECTYNRVPMFEKS